MPVYFPVTGGALFRVERADLGPPVSFDNVNFRQDARGAVHAGREAALKLTLPLGISPEFAGGLQTALDVVKDGRLCLLEERLPKPPSKEDHVVTGTSLFGGAFLGYLLLAYQESVRDSTWDPIIVVSAPGSVAQSGLGGLDGLDSKVKTVRAFALTIAERAKKQGGALFLHTKDSKFDPGEGDALVKLREITSTDDLVLALDASWRAHLARPEAPATPSAASAQAHSTPPHSAAGSGSAPPLATITSPPGAASPLDLRRLLVWAFVVVLAATVVLVVLRRSESAPEPERIVARDPSPLGPIPGTETPVPPLPTPIVSPPPRMTSSTQEASAPPTAKSSARPPKPPASTTSSADAGALVTPTATAVAELPPPAPASPPAPPPPAPVGDQAGMDRIR